MMFGRKTAGAPTPSAWFPMAVLVATMGASTWLNVIHAAVTHPAGTPWRSSILVAFALPPILVPTLLELLGREAQRGAASRGLFGTAFAVIVTLALLAFAVSVWAIAALMTTWGAPTPVAVGFPVILDLAAGGSTLFLLDRALGAQRQAVAVAQALDHTTDTIDGDSPNAVSSAPTPTPDYPLLDPATRWAVATTGDIPVITDSTPEPVAVVQREATDVALPVSPAPVVTPPVALSAQVDDTADSDMSSEVSDTADSPVSDSGVDDSTGDSDTADDADTAPAPTATPPADSAVSASADIPADALDAARAVVAATGIKATPRDVAAVITALERGDALAVISRETGVHRTTVRKVRDHLAVNAPAPQRQLAAVS